MATPSDEALLAGIAHGDPAAAGTFVRRHQARVFGLAVTILRDRAAAEDVAQEAFVRVWRHAGSFDARRGDVLPWALTITRNAALDALRMRRAIPTDPEVVGALLPSSTERGPAEAAELRADVAVVRRALLDLPVEQREAVLLAAFGGRTAAEVADHAGIALGTAKTRIRTGLRKLRDAISDEVTR